MAGREEEGTEGCCEWKEQYRTTAFNSGKAVRAAGSQTEGPPQLPPVLTLLIVFLLCFLRMWGRLCCPSDEVSHAALPQTQNRMGVELGNKADLQSGASL